MKLAVSYLFIALLGFSSLVEAGAKDKGVRAH